MLRVLIRIAQNLNLKPEIQWEIKMSFNKLRTRYTTISSGLLLTFFIYLSISGVSSEFFKWLNISGIAMTSIMLISGVINLKSDE